MVSLLATLSLSPVSQTSAGEVEYIYDDLNRVKDIIYDGRTKLSYTYDHVGNRQAEVTDTDGDGIADHLDPFPTNPAQ